MKRFTILSAFVLAMLGLSAGPAEAYPHGPSDFVRCDSFGRGANRCPTNGAIAAVEIRNQHSGAACVYGSTWGNDDYSIWVSDGCRATFQVYYYYNHPSPPPYYPVFCGRYNGFLNVPPRTNGWLTLACPAGCRLANWAHYGSPMPCQWNVNAVAATLTCFNPNPFYVGQVPQVTIDCVR